MSAPKSSWPVLVGLRCTLRVLKLDNVDAWRAGDDEEQQRWFDAPGPAPRDNVERAIAEWRRHWQTDGPMRHWGIWCSDRLAGGVELHDGGDRAANLSYVVFPDFRRRGIAVEATRLAVDWGFRHLPIDAVVAVINELNVASRAVVTTLGFTFDGVADPAKASKTGDSLRYVLPNPR